MNQSIEKAHRQEMRRLRGLIAKKIKNRDLVSRKYIKYFFPSIYSEVLKQAKNGVFPRTRYRGKWYYEKRKIKTFPPPNTLF